MEGVAPTRCFHGDDWPVPVDPPVVLACGQHRGAQDPAPAVGVSEGSISGEDAGHVLNISMDVPKLRDQQPAFRRQREGPSDARDGRIWPGVPGAVTREPGLGHKE